MALAGLVAAATPLPARVTGWSVGVALSLGSRSGYCSACIPRPRRHGSTHRRAAGRMRLHSVGEGWLIAPRAAARQQGPLGPHGARCRDRNRDRDGHGLDRLGIPPADRADPGGRRPHDVPRAAILQPNAGQPRRPSPEIRQRPVLKPEEAEAIARLPEDATTVPRFGRSCSNRFAVRRHPHPDPRPVPARTTASASSGLSTGRCRISRGRASGLTGVWLKNRSTRNVVGPTTSRVCTICWAESRDDRAMAITVAIPITTPSTVEGRAGLVGAQLLEAISQPRRRKCSLIRPAARRWGRAVPRGSRDTRRTIPRP